MENYSAKLTKWKTYHHYCCPTNAIHIHPHTLIFPYFPVGGEFFLISQLQTYSKDSIYVYLFNKYVLNPYYASWIELKANILMIGGDSTYFINKYTTCLNTKYSTDANGVRLSCSLSTAELNWTTGKPAWNQCISGSHTSAVA